MREEHYPIKARQAVVEYINTNAQVPLVTVLDTHVVWFTKINKNWKAFVSVDIPEYDYYEVTYDGETNELILDVYIKAETVSI